MKIEWPIKTLGELFEITSSKRVFEADWKREGVPFYRAREIVKIAKQGFVDNELFISEEMFNQYSTKYGIPEAGDIMVTGVGTLGICYVVKENDRFYFKDGNIIWLKKRSDANSRYIEYAFQSDYLRDQIDDSVGATVGTFTIIKAKSTRIPVPPLPEQRRIVGILDEVYEGIAAAKASAERNLQNARALFESHLQSVFSERGKGWKRVRIEDACESIMDCVNKTAPKAAGPTPFIMIRTTNVRNGLINLESVNYVTETVFRTWTRRQTPRRGDVILTREAPIGEVGMLLSDNNVFLGQRLVSYRADPAKLSNHFLLYALQSENMQVQIQMFASGSTVQHMRVPDSKKLLLPLPSLSVQEGEAEKLNYLRNETRRLELIYQRKLATLEELKKSLLHQAFHGEL